MAMEFLEGNELKDIIASGNLMPVDQVVDIIAQVADGLWFAHQQDIVHRDVKPSNIMVMHGRHRRRSPTSASRACRNSAREDA